MAVRCDHRDDDQTRQVVERIQQETGRLDVLVNNVWGGYEHFYDGTEFWLETGQVVRTWQLAREYDFTDLDGRQPGAG